jgi:hypothetical protein
MNPALQTILWVQFIPFTVMSIAFAVVAYLLAKEKGRNVMRWTVLGLVPVVNWFCLPFFIGATNLRLEAKIDQLLRK